VKAIWLSAHGSAANFSEVDLPVPEPGPGAVRIRVRAIGFNPVDVQLRAGSVPNAPVRMPVLGRDLSGTIDAVHESVKAFRPGDEVYSYVCELSSSGAYAEYVCVPEELVALKPARLTHEQAASVPVAARTATLALQRTLAGPAKSMLVIGGAGGVGSFVIALAQELGMQRLVTMAGNAASRDYLTGECGLKDDQVVDYRRGGLADLALLANGGAYDVVIDLVGGLLLSEGCKALAIGGNLASATEGPGRDDIETLFARNASFHTIGAHADSLSTDRRRWIRYRDCLDRITTGLDSGSLRLPRVTDVGPWSLATVQRAHELLERGSVQGKLVMSC
jgi:NADPH:quinone reductase-like Zn-dependent oxidoreductase